MHLGGLRLAPVQPGYLFNYSTVLYWCLLCQLLFQPHPASLMRGNKASIQVFSEANAISAFY
jgi:hypothetical protein